MADQNPTTPAGDPGATPGATTPGATTPGATTPGATTDDTSGVDATRGTGAADLLAELDGLHDLAIRAEQLAQLLGMHGGHDQLTGAQLSTLELARDNAAAIVASLDRAS